VTRPEGAGTAVGGTSVGAATTDGGVVEGDVSAAGNPELLSGAVASEAVLVILDPSAPHATPTAVNATTNSAAATL